MRVLIEMSMQILDPPALLARARDHHERFGAAIDVTDMTTKEALAVDVDDMTKAELRAHPRYVTAQQQVPDVASAAVAIAKQALEEAGGLVESSSAETLLNVTD